MTPKLSLCALLAALTLAPLAPAQAGTQTLVYEVYAGGIHALQATMNLETGKGRYDITLDAKTRGLLGRLAPWEGSFESHGWIEKDGAYKPELHKSIGIWRGEKEVKEYKYTREGGFVSLSETVNGAMVDKSKDIGKELTDGTTDALTAALNVFEAVARGEACSGTEEVFDGKRRFEQIFTDQGSADLEPTKYNIFKGAATECTVEVKPVAGAWSKKPRGWLSIQEQGRERGTMPTLWTAKLKDGEPAVPVKIRIATAYGVLFMHLAEFKDEARTVSAEKRAQK